MGALVLKSENQIVGDQLSKFLAETGINDVNAGSVIRTLLEANAQELFQQYVQLVNVIRNYNLDTTTGSDLDNRGAEYGVVRFLAEQATGTVSILRPASFQKVSTGLYTGFPSPSVGDTVLRVNDASNSLYGSSGTLIVGRGTSNEEEVTYSAAPVNNTNYWQFTTSPFSNNHGSDESVILKQGDDELIRAGTTLVVPASGSSPQITFTVNSDTTLLAGESEIDNVDVTCTIAGSVGNIPIQAINGTSAFSSPPFSGAQAFNYAKFTTGQDQEIDDDYRNRIKNTIQSLSKATKLALLNAIIGLVDPTTAKRVVSSNIVLPTIAGDPVKIYIDDGTGFEPSFSSRGFEQVIDSATGGENRLQLDFGALVKAQVESSASTPFDMQSSSGLTLTYQVGLASETITFLNSDFAFPQTASAQEIVAAINNKATLIEARTANIGTQVVISAVADTNENIQVTGGTANDVLLFPTDQRSTLFLYINDVLQSKDGATAFIDTGNQATYNFSSLGAGPWPLNITVDGKSANPQIVNFVSGDFANPAQALASEVVAAINARLAGATAFVLNGVKVRLVSNNQFSSGSKLQVTGGSANSVLGFPGSAALGADQNYTLNRELGAIQLANPLNKFDTVTAGSRFTRAFARSISPESFSVTAGQTLVISVDGGADQTITFGSTATYTATQAASIINQTLLGATATVRTIGGLNYLEITTNSYAQAGGRVQVKGSSTATAFNFLWDQLEQNQRPQKAFVTSQSSGPYVFTVGQTLVVVIDGNAATETFTINFGFSGVVTQASSVTAFKAAALGNQFVLDSDLPGFYLVALTGANTTTGVVSSVTNISGNTWQYDFNSLPAGLASMAAGDHVSFSNMQSSGNNGGFIISAVNTSGNGYVQVTNPAGVAESGSTGAASIGQRRQIQAYTASTGSITLTSGFSNTPSIGDSFSLLPYTVSNVVTYMSNRKVSTLVASAEVLGATGNTQVQIASLSDGSDGTVQVTGGSANTVLEFSTTPYHGLAGYSYYTGLSLQVHKTIYGDDADLISFPGVGAAGIDFQILAPTVQIVSFDLTLTLAQGVSVSSLQDQVKSAISGYVNSLGVGDDLILSIVIQKIMEIDNILDVEITIPTGNVAIADNEIARTSDAYITVG